MANPLFGLFGAGSNLGNMASLLQHFHTFKNSFKGDPREQVQQMLNSGKITQAQYNDAVQKANAFMKYLK